MKVKALLLSVGLFCFFSSFANAERPFRGFYEVPVTESLKAFSSYPVRFKSDNYQENPNTISFPMPSSLLGDETIVTMSKENSQSTNWSGPNVKGNCETVGWYFKCRIRFEKVSVDQSKVEALISEQYRSSEEIAGRIQVARVFSAEPIGILIYKMRGQSTKK